MAKKSKTNNTEVKRRSDTTSFCAFWSLAISAIMYIAGGVIRFIKWLWNNIDPEVGTSLEKVSGILLFLGNVALIIAIAIPAYNYVKGRGKGWKIFYGISLAIFILGVVFGLLPNF